MSKQYLDRDGLQVVANKINKKISTVTEMPGSVSNGTVVLYKGEDTEQYSWGHIYESFNTMLYAWKDSEDYVIYTDTETPENGSVLYATSNGQAATSENQPKLVSFSVASYDSANSTITDTDNYTYTRESSLDFDSIYWDDITAAVSGIKPTDSIPVEAKPGTAYLYIGSGTSHEYGHIYYTDGNERYYAWGYEFRPDEWGYDYTLTPTPQVGDTTVNGGEITAVADDYSTITVNNRYWMRFSNRDYDNARWVDTTPIEIPTYDLINTGTAVEPVFDWIQICQNVKDADFSARVPITLFKLYGRGYGSGTSYYSLSYFGTYNRKHNGATGPDDSLIEEFTIYAGTKLVVVHYDMSDRTWSYEESSIGADEEARETAAGAIGLAQQAMENSSDVYSVNEVKTNKIWLDGKPIYRKVLTLSSAVDNITQSTLKNINSNLVETTSDILALNIDDVTTMMKLGNNTIGYSFLLNSSNGAVSVVSNNEYNTSLSKGYHILLEYTKTTD